VECRRAVDLADPHQTVVGHLIAGASFPIGSAALVVHQVEGPQAAGLQAMGLHRKEGLHQEEEEVEGHLAEGHQAAASFPTY